MRVTVGGRGLTLVQGDITGERVDAIVTAANSTLAGGGGVDGAVHHAAGPALLAECRKVDGGCPTGQAVATRPGKLPVKRVIHAVGPIWGEERGREDELLASAHRRALEVAAAEGCTSIAFPAISCGVYGFPIDRAARIAMSTIVEHLAGETPIREVRYVLFSRADLATFRAGLEEVARSDPRVTPA